MPGSPKWSPSSRLSHRALHLHKLRCDENSACGKRQDADETALHVALYSIRCFLILTLMQIAQTLQRGMNNELGRM